MMTRQQNEPDQERFLNSLNDYSDFSTGLQYFPILFIIY
ncbi:Uncharacterized protein dnm_023720 [Desulfonema magnum]|uniref:Uncharacterized protein n=1 Tax=Desulfonema magnum TaxID=45655 RepID=A0A975BJM3_9BACT|nr:Uncharacterized protein dnm_023720 [Desulfonema magnum]